MATTGAAGSMGTETESTGVRNRGPRYQPPPGDWDPNQPYGGKVFLARKKKPDPWYIILLEAIVIIGTVCFGYYAYYYIDNVQFHLTHGYAHLGFAEAQHQVGQRFMLGKGTKKNTAKAIHWFKKASANDHAEAHYNLAVAHIKRHKTGLPRGHAHHLLHKAAENGVYEAKKALEDICARGDECDV